MEKARITIIGLGRVGKALLKVLSEQGFEVISAYNRSDIIESSIKSYAGTQFYVGDEFSKLQLGDWVFITVSDDAISPIAKELAQLQKGFENKMVVHCSGTLSSQVLEPLRQKGATTASFHPLKSITPKTTNFSNTWFDVEGDEYALITLKKVANILGAKALQISPEAKPLLHAAAVVASNYIVVLADLVTKIAPEAEISESVALQALTPLMQNTLQNINELGVADALTGPIARGDIETIRTHLSLLKEKPELLSLYKTLGRGAVNISETKQGDASTLTTIKNLLRE